MEEVQEENVQIPFGREPLDGVLSLPGARHVPRAALVLTHGAGGDAQHVQLRSLARRAASAGLPCLRFTCRGANLAHRTRAFGAALDFLKNSERFTLTHFFLGGRSMGSRAAVALAVQQSGGAEDALRGLVCLSFPLHPPGQTHRYLQRSEDLRKLARVPVLFVSGTADTMCQRKLLEDLMMNMQTQTTVHWIRGGGHGLKVKGQSEDAVLEEVNTCIVAWILEHSRFYTQLIFPVVYSLDGRARQLLEACERVLLLLRSRVLRAELRVLYAVLRVCNNSLRQHKPFRAIKQVERCINRVKEMKLIPALLDLLDMCPRQALRQVMAGTGQCEVPSQPTLEWFCVKVLGANKLMACLVDHCLRAFVLIQKQLYCEESVVLNLVLVSMLSRLRVFFIGILRNLPSLYNGALELLEEVAQARPMPYLTDFTLPAVLPTFTGTSHWAQAEAELLKETTKMRIIGRKWNKRPVPKRRVDRTFMEDLGSRVLQSSPSVRGDTCQIGPTVAFDIKAMLKRSTGNDRKVVAYQLKTLKDNPALIVQKRRFLKKVVAASSFSDMATHLAEAIRWCRSRKLQRESCRLTFLNLKCQRMKWLEMEGFRLERKLKSFRRQFAEAVQLLRRPTSTRPQLSLHDKWRSYYFRKRFECVMRGRRWNKQVRQNDLKIILSETPQSAEIQNEDKNGKGKYVETSACVWSTSGSEIDDIFASLDF